MVMVMCLCVYVFMCDGSASKPVSEWMKVIESKSWSWKRRAISIDLV